MSFFKEVRRLSDVDRSSPRPPPPPSLPPHPPSSSRHMRRFPPRGPPRRSPHPLCVSLRRHHPASPAARSTRHAARRTLLHRHARLVRMVRNRGKSSGSSTSTSSEQPPLPRQRPYSSISSLSPSSPSLRRTPTRVVSPAPHHLAPRHPALPHHAGAALVHRRPESATQPSTASSSSPTHNLERFATNRFQHHQPFLLLPPSSFSHRPYPVDRHRHSGAASPTPSKSPSPSGRGPPQPPPLPRHMRAGDAFPEFLVLWALFPILFFSTSPAPSSPATSFLPFYLSPSSPRRLSQPRPVAKAFPKWLLWGPRLLPSAPSLHGLRTFSVLAPQHMKYETLVPSRQWLTAAAACRSSLWRCRLPYHPTAAGVSHRSAMPL